MRPVNKRAILETCIVCVICAVAVVVAATVSRVAPGALAVGVILLLMVSMSAAVVALLNHRAGHEDIAAGLEEFSHDRSFRFEGKDDAYEELNELFDTIQYNDEQNRLLIRNISHEVKTPLTGLKVLAEGISDGVFPADRDHMRAMLADVRRIDETLEVMRKYSDIMDDNRMIGEGADAASALIDAYGRAKRVAPESVEVVIKSKPKDGFKTKVNTDSSSLATLFDIVIGNSFEHAKGMTRLEFSLTNAPEPSSGTEMLKISIADDGCGTDLDWEKARRAFSKQDDVRTVSERSKVSLGLGLSVADKIVTRAGGNISITSKPGRGTCTTMWFPCE